MYPNREVFGVILMVAELSYCILTCPPFRAVCSELITGDDEEFAILRLIGRRLLFVSWWWLLFAWLTVRCGCWLTATRITCWCCGVTLGTDWRSNEDVAEWLFVSIGTDTDDDDDERCCDVSVDTWRETLPGDVRLTGVLLLVGLLLLISDENDIHISVLGKRSVHL